MAGCFAITQKMISLAGKEPRRILDRSYSVCNQLPVEVFAVNTMSFPQVFKHTIKGFK